MAGTTLPLIFDEDKLGPEDRALVTNMADGVLFELFHFCFAGRRLDRPKEVRTALRCFVSVVWLIRPDLLQDGEGKRMSLADLAALPEVDCSKYFLSMLAGAFAKKWGFHSMTQKRPGSRENFAAGAKIGWAKRRRAKEHGNNGNGHGEEL